MREYLRVLLLLAVIVAPVSSQCVTYSSYVYCTDCPNPSLFPCWDSGSVSYTVYGPREETWCTWTYHSGWCANLNGACTTVSGISTSVDCLGFHYATQATICCVAP